MTTVPGELSASALIGLMESGGYSRDVVLTIARGFLPLEQTELITVLCWLGVSQDEDISNAARASLLEIPGRAQFDYASNESLPAECLLRFLGLTTDPIILETLIRNRTIPDGAVEELARTAEPRVQDVIVINQARILRAPGILDALLANPSLTPDARRRVLETREEFFVKKRIPEPEPEPEEEELSDAPLDAIADLLERAEAEGEAAAGGTTVTLNESEKGDPKKRAIWARLNFMSVSEKVQLAYRGDRMVRMFLVRERNRLVCSAVMRNPRLTEQEVEGIAGMRNVEEEVLRLIGTRRDFAAKYNIMLTLVRNPKAPVGVVLPFINRLTLRDLKGLKDDKGVQQIVREMAKKAYLARTQKAG